MPGLELQTTARGGDAPDLAAEIARLETFVAERGRELTAMQEEFRLFKTHYTQVVGSRLAQLADLEQAITEAEARLLGVEADDEPAEAEIPQATPATQTVTGSLRQLFWSVAKMFHPDHATDETEARRRHTVMAEASRAYREGDAESLSALLGDDDLQFFCTAKAQAHDDPKDLAGRLLELKEELRTVEFGIKRLKQNGLYQLKQRVEEEAQGGRDALTEQAERLNRQIAKARHRLANLSS